VARREILTPRHLRPTGKNTERENRSARLRRTRGAPLTRYHGPLSLEEAVHLLVRLHPWREQKKLEDAIQTIVQEAAAQALAADQATRPPGLGDDGTKGVGCAYDVPQTGRPAEARLWVATSRTAARIEFD